MLTIEEEYIHSKSVALYQIDEIKNKITELGCYLNKNTFIIEQHPNTLEMINTLNLMTQSLESHIDTHL